MLHLKISTPDRVVLEMDNIEMVGAEGVEGDFSVLPNHIPFITKTKPGILRVRSKGGETKSIAIGPGFFEVSDNSVILITDDAILPEEADKKRAEEARRIAEEQLQKKLEGTDFQRVEAELRRSLLELKLIDHIER